MTGVEVAAAAAAVYVARKLRRVAGRVDGEVDRALDAGMDAVHDLVGTALGDDPALRVLEEQAGQGTDGERTRRRVADALADAAEADPDLAERLITLIEELQDREAAQAPVQDRSVSISGDNDGIVSTGDSATNTQNR